MNQKTIKLVKGDLISTKGKHFRVTGIAKVRVIPEKENHPIVGEHQSDVDPKEIKRIYCQIIEDRIKELEREENNSLYDILEDDPLFEFDDGYPTPKADISDQVGRTSSIMELKQLLKKIKAL